METAKNIANYMLSKKALTPKQVQKLLYYAYSLYLIKYNEEYNKDNMDRLFDEKIEAWEHGPVIKTVYDYIRKVALSYELVACKAKVELNDKKIENFIDKILAVYGQYTGYELELMTHNEAPWREAFNLGRNYQISDKTIYDYYSSKYKNVQEKV